MIGLNVMSIQDHEKFEFRVKLRLWRCVYVSIENPIDIRPIVIRHNTKYPNVPMTNGLIETLADG